MTFTNKIKFVKANSSISLFCSMLCFIFMGIQQSFAQERITLEGKITNAINKVPISDAAIVIRNVNNGTASDAKGNYSLGGIKAGDVIEVSKLGFKTVIYTVTSKRKNQKWDVVLTDDLLSLSEVVVTSFGGTLNLKEKIESSVAITTINSKEIDERLPRNNSDLLKAIPGFWVESAGGDGPGSVWVRGFPQAGGYAFLGIMEDGLPVFQTGYYNIPSPDLFYKIDETLNKVEAIRGGSSPIIMQGAVGAVVNHISKTGGKLFKGSTKLSYNPLQGLGRIDLNLGGPMSKSTTYNLGGFYRDETGLYDYGYSTNRGGQIKANIEQKFNKVRIKYSGKYINDHVNWNLPTPYMFNKNGDVDEIEGFNIKSAGIGTNVSDTEYAYTLPSGRAIEGDLKDGFYTNLISGGLELDFTLGKNWSLVNKFRYDDIEHDNNSDVITDIQPLDPTVNYTYTDGTPINDPGTLNGNGLQAINFILKTDNKYQQLINRMELSNTTQKNTFTFGTEYYHYTLQNDAVSSINSKEITNSPRVIVDPNNPFGAHTPLSFFDDSGQNQAQGIEETISLYIDDQLKASDKLSLNVGLRYDYKTVDGYSATQTPQIITPAGQPLAFVITGKQEFEDSRSSYAATLGLNFKINNNSSLFARSTLANNSLKIGDYTSTLSELDELKAAKNSDIFQSELGFKYRGDKTALFSSIIYATVGDAISPIALPSAQGALLFQNIFQSTRTISAEVEAQYRPNNKWLFKLINTLQDAEYSKLNFVANPGTIIAGQEFDWSGNKAEHVPSIASDLYVAYTIKKLSLSADVRYYGDRWSTPANNIKLKGYAEFNAGLNYIFNPRLNLRIQGANLFNTVALIEGNTRGDQFITADAIDGRPAIGKRILPRALFFKLIYNFGI